MERFEKVSRKWWFFVILLSAQSILLPIVSRNFDPQNIPGIISATLGNAVQCHLGNLNILFQSLSVLMLVLLIVLKNKVRTLFNAYVAVSYIAFAFIQNIAVTEQYGFSVVTINFAMFLFVAYVWIREVFRPENEYDFKPFQWKYVWMIIMALFAFYCPFNNHGELDWNLAHFFTRNTATAFCLTTPLFLTILTLNLPRVNIVTYRVTAIIGVIIGLYNMMNFFNPHTVYLGVVHLPLVSISLYCAILSYKVKSNASNQ